MKRLLLYLGIIVSLFSFSQVFGQQVLVSEANKKKLADLSLKLNKQYLAAHKKALALAKIHGWPIFRIDKDGRVISLQGVNSLGLPVYLITDNNTTAAATTGTNTVQPGGALGLNLSGSSPGLANKIAMWDGGSVYTAHQEFAGKIITDHDPAPIIDHATHVAGTMIALGVFPPAKGMAFNASTLQSYFFNNDVGEMSTAASGLLLSNHSYDDGAGWYFNASQNRWEWYGIPGNTVDYKFGFYGQKTQAFDDIAYFAPYYLIVEAAGNNHGSTGPAIGADYFGYASITDPTVVDKGPRPANMSSNNGYDVISTTSNAKNILTVGAVNPLPNGPGNGQGISIAPFSSWGPTDDGRIKPDIVGDGVNVLSTGSANPNNYITFSGTSMATPNVTGSLYLLQEYYAQKNTGSFMRAATLKGLACHTAVDAGNPGPDYIYGWGLLNMKAAVQAITDNGTKSMIKENTLQQGLQQTVTVMAAGNVPLSATISWTDPAGAATPDGTLNSRIPELVNDLDIRVSDGITTFNPWILDPSNPSAAATTGDNILDNIEQVFIPGAVPGKTYTITVSHKGILQSGSQEYSLIVTGIGIPVPSIKASILSGSITACAGTASSNPNIQQIMVSGTKLTGNITATAPPGFEISLAAGGGFGNTLNLPLAGGAVGNTVIYVRSAAGAPAGHILGNVVLTSSGIKQNVIVTGQVNALAIVNPVPNQGPIPNGSSTQAINFTGTANSYNWVNDTPGIGLAASGTGNISPFTAVNNTNKPITATVTVTPVPLPPLAYVANAGPNSVSVINTVTRQIIAQIPVGTSPFGVAVSPDGSRVYVTNTQSNDVSVINAATNSTIATIPVKLSPRGVATSPDGNTVYVSDDINVYVISAATNAITTTIVIGQYADAIAVSPDGSKVYVTNTYDKVFVINAATNMVIDSIFVGANADPWGICVSPGGDRIYVANTIANNISVIDAGTDAIVATIPVATGPWGICMSPDGSRIYESNSGDNVFGGLAPGTVSVINATNNSVITTIPVGTYPGGISVTPDGSQVYVANDFGAGNGGTVSVINTATNTVSATINLGVNPISLGNFISNDTQCASAPIKFTITVNPSPVITAGLATGSISACMGSASISPDIEQFTVSGLNLTGDITATAPTDFEVSLTPGNGYSSSVTLTQSGGTVNNTIVYVRSSASASTDNISGNVVLTSLGAANQNVVVTGSMSTQVNPSISITASANNICAGMPVTFTATSANGGSAPVYKWLVNGNNSGTNSATFSSSTLVNGDIVSCVMTSNAACAAPVNIASNSIVINVNPQTSPLISIAASANNICAGTPVTFTATSTNGGITSVYHWMVNGNNAGTDSAAFTSNALSNGDKVNCIMTSSAGCFTPADIMSNIITMNVNPLPIVNAGGNKTIKLGSSTILNAAAIGNITNITWSPAIGLNNNKILNPVASPSTTTTYTLTVQTSEGCFGKDIATVEVLQNITIPNAFTPNGDGVNDTWNVKFLDTYANCTVEIYNRYGENVYSSIGYGIPWDGTYKGSSLPTGTYYYIINLRNGSNVLSGFVAIIR